MKNFIIKEEAAAELFGLRTVYLPTIVENKNAFTLYNNIGFKHILIL